MTNAVGKSAGALPADINKAGIACDLIQSGQGALRLWQQFVIEVGFKLQKSIVDAQTVVFHAAFKQSDQFLLAS